MIKQSQADNFRGQQIPTSEAYGLLQLFIRFACAAVLDTWFLTNTHSPVLRPCRPHFKLTGTANPKRDAGYSIMLCAELWQSEPSRLVAGIQSHLVQVLVVHCHEAAIKRLDIIRRRACYRR